MLRTLFSTIKNIPRRLVKASGYSWDGLKNAWAKEEAVRLEFLGFVLLAITLVFVPWPVWKKLALAAVFMLIPVVELLNSAVEDICDLVSPDFHPLVKAAKDKGSAAVLLAIIVNALALAALIVL